MSRKALGRCPDCGDPAPTIVRDGQAAEVCPHECRARACEYPGCAVRRPREEMTQYLSGAWYCASHTARAARAEYPPDPR
jgi:hypothetical protein